MLGTNKARQARTSKLRLFSCRTGPARRDTAACLRVELEELQVLPVVATCDAVKDHEHLPHVGLKLLHLFQLSCQPEAGQGGDLIHVSNVCGGGGSVCVCVCVCVCVGGGGGGVRDCSSQ